MLSLTIIASGKKRPGDCWQDISVTQQSSPGSVSSVNSISTEAVEQLIEQLKYQHNRDSTKKNYYAIWKVFNQFYLCLDRKPKRWEDRLVLFVGYMINKKCKSSTIRSYICEIKSVLKDVNVRMFRKIRTYWAHS